MTVIAIIAVYLVVLLVLGAVASRYFRGSSEDYMVASHSIGPFLLLMSLFGTTMTAFALVGSSGEAYTDGIGVYGMLASSSGIIHSLCFLLIGVKLWSFGKRYGYTTQVQFFRDRLESDRIGLLLFPILAGSGRALSVDRCDRCRNGRLQRDGRGLSSPRSRSTTMASHPGWPRASSASWC